ncbi:MAG: response regulator transcription factor [Acidobacteria bacterium]|nr:response regulator transcription factor [Acidobacteriota bacterium]
MISCPIRVLIADDHSIVREGLVSIIGREVDMKVVAAAATGRQTVELFWKHTPDVTLLDLRMPEMDGIEVMRAIHPRVPAARFLVLTIYDGDEEVFQALDAGALGYILKQDMVMSELLRAIRAVHSGLRWVPPGVAARLVEHLTQPELSGRQVEVLRLIVKGLSNKEIATTLSVTESTVKGYVNAILRKLGVTDRTQAAIVAVRRGIAYFE